MRWPSPIIETVERAVAGAREGTPRVVAIEGEAGFGKTALIREVLGRLDGFRVLRAFGEESSRDERHQVLREWDLLPDPAPRHTLQAMRLLGGLVDGSEGPVALVLDDLHWIDPESVDALAALVQRAAGDRLLVVAGYRPSGQAHPAWRRLVGDAGVAETITLDGLAPDAAAALVGPDAPDGLAEALRVHTGGSPLHVLALLREHPVGELASLAARGELASPGRDEPATGRTGQLEGARLASSGSGGGPCGPSPRTMRLRGRPADRYRTPIQWRRPPTQDVHDHSFGSARRLGQAGGNRRIDFRDVDTGHPLDHFNLAMMSLDALRIEVRGIDDAAATDLDGLADRLEDLHRAARREDPSGTDARWRRVVDDAERLERKVARLKSSLNPLPPPPVTPPAPATRPAAATPRAPRAPKAPKPPAEHRGQRWVHIESDTVLHRVISGEARRTICGQTATPGMPDLSAEGGRRCPLCSIGDTEKR